MHGGHLPPPPATDGRTDDGVPARRQWLHAVLLLTGLAVAVWLLAPQVHEVPAGLAALVDARPGWLALAVGIALLPFLAAALALQGAVPARLHYGHITQVQIAGAFATAIAPAGVAAMALTARYLARAGVPRDQALAAVAVVRIAATAAHVLLLALLAPIVLEHVVIVTPSVWWLAATAAVAGSLALLVRFVPALRARAATGWAKLARPLRQIAPDGPRVGLLVIGSVAISATRALTLYACLLAVGARPPLLAVVGLFLAAEAAGLLATTPAGLGVLDGIALAGLAAFGVAIPVAIAAVLLFRLLTFWAPMIPGALTLWRLRHTGRV